MSPTTWLGTDDVGGFVLGRFRQLDRGHGLAGGLNAGRCSVGRLGHLDRLVIGSLDHDHAPPAAIQADLLGSAAGQVDQRPAAHAVIHHHHHRSAGLLHRDPHPGPERQAAARRCHAVLMEDFAAAGASAVVMGAVPGRHTGVGGIGDGWHEKGKGGCDDPWQAALDWHGRQSPHDPVNGRKQTVSAPLIKIKRSASGNRR
jgi:hypothetical protein